MAFFGEYQVSVTKGERIVIPKKIRANIVGTVFILTKGFDLCLAGYDKSDWERRTEELLTVSLLDKEHIERRRMLFSGANEIEIDEQGRFVIPKALLEFIGKSCKQVIIIGVGDHFEIWSSNRWQEYQQMKFENISS